MKNVLTFPKFLIYLGLIFLVYSCAKEEVTEVVDSEFMIDGVSQVEVITDFDIDGVSVIDGRLAFVDHDAMMDATYKLADYNTESVVAWSKKIGFTSLFTELTRIEEKSLEDIKAELNLDMYKEYFYISEDENLHLSKHSLVHARIFNTQGLIQVGDFVGTMSNGLNVWVRPNNVDKLVEALKNHYIPDNDRSYFVINDEAFKNNRDWTQSSTCPKDQSWLGPVKVYKHPSKKRRLEIRHQYYAPRTMNNDGTYNYDAEYWINTVSRKGKRNKYKTDHYLSIDIRTTPFSGIPIGTVVVRQNIDLGDTHTKYGNIVNHIAKYRHVSNNFLLANGERLIETIPGSSGLSGTAGSHRGMGNRYARMDCD